jgi:membrane protein involved in colicin uptake
MSEGQLQRSVASSAQHRQEAEVVVAEERERAATETAATTTRAAKLAMAELAVARVEVEAAAAVDAARVAVAELEALRGSSTSSSISIDGGTDKGGNVRAGGVVGSCAP